MDNNAHRIECPRCSRPLQRFNGHIGYCSLHKWVSPTGLGFEAEAADQNRLDEAAENNRRLEKERQKAAEEEKLLKKKHQRAVRRVTLIVLTLACIAAGVFFFLVRPKLRYSAAAESFSAGQYDAAREVYASLGKYRDSAARVVLCDAMADLRGGNTKAAADKLEQLLSDGQCDASGELAKELSSLAASWRDKGLTPQALLLLLDKIELIDPEGKLDATSLWAEGHAALLDQTTLDSYTEDIDKDGEAELVALNDDYRVSVYRMRAEGNSPRSVSDEQLAACAIRFGLGFEEKELSVALACYEEAHRLAPTEETLGHLSRVFHTAVSEWEDRQIPAGTLPALILKAGQYGLDLSDLDWETEYKKAALLCAEDATQSDFVDWNRDGYPELLTMDAAGKLSLYAAGEEWGIVSQIDTAFPKGSYAITDASAPLILAFSAKQDGFAAVTGSALSLRLLFEEHEISDFRQSGSEIAFSRKLEGSIARSIEYQYTALGLENRPVRTGIDWQQSSYPKPRTAEAAALRYWEARTYEISEEAALLIQSPRREDIFSTEVLEKLPKPDSLGSIEISSYQREDERVLFEVSYLSDERPVRTWLCAEYTDEWRLSGAADTFGAGQDAKAMDTTIPLLCLNEETEHVIAQKNGHAVYRVLIPAPGRLTLQWQSGAKAGSSVSYAISMLRGELTGEALFSYELKPSPQLQQSPDLFVPAGVYYVSVEARTANAEAYRLTLRLREESNIEVENNDSSANATRIALNTPYSASLSSARDVDFFSFELEEASAVKVTLNSSGSGSRTTVYAYAVYNGTDGTKLTEVTVPGNTQLSDTGNLYLSAGVYYVQVAKGSSSTRDEYVLTVRADPGGILEAESNDSQESANAVPVNQDVRGSFARQGDVDFFSFSLDTDAVIQPRFSFKPTESSSKTYVLTILNGSRRELLKANIGGKESSKSIAPLALPAGTYYVKIENPQFVRQDYTLHLACMPADSAEREPNDSAGLATELLLGQPRTGVLSSAEDADYYRLNFTKDTIVTLQFSFAQGSSTNTAFELRIEQNGKSQWSAKIKADSGGLEQQLSFPAGEYYIRVKPSTWMSAVYTIQIH